jgi:hypothetical protein
MMGMRTGTPLVVIAVALMLSSIVYCSTRSSTDGDADAPVIRRESIDADSGVETPLVVERTPARPPSVASTDSGQPRSAASACELIIEVRDAAGELVAGHPVQLVPLTDLTPDGGWRRTGQDGAVRVVVAPGEYYARALGGRKSWTGSTEDQARIVIPLELQLVLRPVLVHVLDESGMPVEGAEVHMSPWQRMMLGTGVQLGLTDAQGELVIQASDGHIVWSLLRTGDAGRGYSLPAVVEGPECQLVLKRSARCASGTVRDLAGSPVPGVRVAIAGDLFHPNERLTDAPTFASRTDENGEFELCGLPARPLSLWVEGTETLAAAVIDIDVRSRDDLDVTLVEGIELVVERHPAVGYSYLVFRYPMQAPNWWVPAPRRHLESEARVSFGPMPTGTWFVYSEPEGAVEASRKFDVLPGERARRHLVLDESRAMVEVSLRVLDGPIGSIRSLLLGTESGGEVEVPVDDQPARIEVSPGRSTVRALVDLGDGVTRLSDRVTVGMDPIAIEVSLDCRSTGRLRVEASELGSLARGSRLTLYSDAEGGRERIAVLTLGEPVAGYFDWPWIPRGHYQLAFYDATRALRQIPVEVR